MTKRIGPDASRAKVFCREHAASSHYPHKSVECGLFWILTYGWIYGMITSTNEIFSGNAQHIYQVKQPEHLSLTRPNSTLSAFVRCPEDSRNLFVGALNAVFARKNDVNLATRITLYTTDLSTAVWGKVPWISLATLMLASSMNSSTRLLVSLISFCSTSIGSDDSALSM